MNEVKLLAENGEYLCFYMDKEFYENGKSEIEIKVSNYYVRGIVWFSFGELPKFSDELKQLYKRMQGKVVLVDSECNLAITFFLNPRGYFVINGRYKENLSKDNELLFELTADQPSMDRWMTKLSASLRS